MGRKVAGHIVADAGVDIERLIYMQKDLDLKLAEDRYNRHHPATPIKVERFEDIPESQIEHEVAHLIKNLKNNNKESFKEVYRENAPQHMLKDMDDEGDELFIQENELLMEGDDDSNELQAQEIDKVKERISYILKMLHEESKECGYHLISYAIAISAVYERNVDKTGYVITPRDIYIKYDKDYTGNRIEVFNISQKGNDLYQITENKNRGEEIMKWVKGIGEHRDIYRDLVDELIILSEDVGMPLYRENPHDYTERTISKIVSTYLLENRQYMRELKRVMHEETFNSIQNINILDFNVEEKPKKEKRSSEIDRISEIYENCVKTANLFEITDHPLLKSEEKYKPFGSLQSLFLMHNEVSPIKLSYNEKELNKLQTYDGFLCYPSGNFVIMNVGLYKNNDWGQDTILAIFHESGKVIRLVENSTRLDYIDFAGLYMYVEQRYRLLKEQAKLPSNYGKWETVLV